ncbi:MAG: hypothetical protein WA947_21310 [Phormidesmis sp.]
MFIPSTPASYVGSAAASTSTAALPVALPSSTPIPQGKVRHLLFGSPAVVQSSIRLLHKLGYAEPNDWSRPISTERANEGWRF